MSLLAPRPMEERASVLLPTVTCSTCAAPIPLSSLGEHICAGPSSGPSSRSHSHSHSHTQHYLPNRAAPRQIPRSSPLSIDTTSRGAQPEPSRAPNAPFARSHGGSPASAGSSGSFNYPVHIPSPASLSAPSPAFGGPGYQARTPSPTNPFFPHNRSPDRAPAGPPAHEQLPDMTSGGGAGMAGVGRRAFAAAAWGVRAGVALANGARQAQAQPQGPSQGQGSGNGLAQGSGDAAYGSQAFPQPTRRDPSPPSRARSPESHAPGYFDRPIRTSPNSSPAPAHSQPTGRARAGTISAGSQPPQPVRQHSSQRKASIDSTISGTSQGGAGDSISQLLKARQGDKPQPQSTKPFFDRYKAMVAGSSASSTSSSSPVLGLSGSRRGSNDAPAPASPEHGCRVYDDDEESVLPWTIPSGDTPDLKHLPKLAADASRGPSALARHKTANSSSSQSSGSSLLSRATEEVVTPSQSWEGIVDRNDYRQAGKPAVGLGFGMDDRDRDGREYLSQIKEDEEHVVFASKPAAGMKPSTSDSSISTGVASNPYRAHSRSHTAPEHHRSPSSGSAAALVSASGSSSRPGTGGARRPKVCAKCSEPVGGIRRFVERDGVVLCERDWKKLYLPSCRKCRLPIEKSAVSSSDGQLKGKWHRACFSCSRCDEALQGDSFYVLDGRPWCQFHYHEENGTLCASSSCRQPIEGKCIVTPGPQPERFHPGHLHCDYTSGAGVGAPCTQKMDEYYAVGKSRYCEFHIGEVMQRERVRGGSSRADKRRTRLVDLGGGGLR